MRTCWCSPSRTWRSAWLVVMALNPVTLAAKAGAEGRLFGSIQTKDIADAVAAAGHGTVDKRVIEIPTPIRSVGDHQATARLRDDIFATITLRVVAAK